MIARMVLRCQHFSVPMQRHPLVAIVKIRHTYHRVWLSHELHFHTLGSRAEIERLFIVVQTRESLSSKNVSHAINTFRYS